MFNQIIKLCYCFKITKILSRYPGFGVFYPKMDVQPKTLYQLFGLIQQDRGSKAMLYNSQNNFNICSMLPMNHQNQFSSYPYILDYVRSLNHRVGLCVTAHHLSFSHHHATNIDISAMRGITSEWQASPEQAWTLLPHGAN